MRQRMMMAATCAAVLTASQVIAAAAPANKPAPARANKPAAAAATPAPKPAMSDKAQIAALERGFIAAFNAKNVNRIMSFYNRADLFVFDVVPPRDYPSWAAYKKRLVEALFGPPTLGRSTSRSPTSPSPSAGMSGTTTRSRAATPPTRPARSKAWWCG